MGPPLSTINVIANESSAIHYQTHAKGHKKNRFSLLFSTKRVDPQSREWIPGDPLLSILPWVAINGSFTIHYQIHATGLNKNESSIFHPLMDPRWSTTIPLPQVAINGSFAIHYIEMACLQYAQKNQERMHVFFLDLSFGGFHQ